MVRTDGCQCYVKTLGAEAMLSLRYGVHSLSCPVYRESRDPVDRLNDDATRYLLAQQMEQEWITRRLDTLPG